MSEKLNQAINIIFDGPPSHESGRFVEVETDEGKSISVGTWVEREDGYWSLRIERTLPPEVERVIDAVRRFLVRTKHEVDSATSHYYEEREILEHVLKALDQKEKS